MLDGRLRIAPTCYHVLHLIPVMSAHEMNFLYDEGLRSGERSPGYEIVRDMPKNFEYIHNLERRLRLQSADPEERGVKISCGKPLDLEAMPFPLNGLATGFEDMLAEEKRLGELNYDVPAINDVCAQDLCKEAFNELCERKELEPEFQRVQAVAKRWGY